MASIDPALIRPDGLRLECHDDPPAQDLGVVDEGLGAFNEAAATLHQVRPLAVLWRDAEGKVRGGAVGRTWGGCCELQQLWVAQALRGQGLARALMAAFEARAAARGCHLFYLETWSFQALGFYQRLGYQEALRIEGFGPGLAKYSLTKRWGQSHGDSHGDTDGDAAGTAT